MQDILNPHYDFTNPENLKVIERVKAYDNAWKSQDLDFIAQAECDVLEGKESYRVNVRVESPWGKNKVLNAQILSFEASNDLVKKEIIVKPGFMLSLQRHRGRQEKWEVTNGTLTVISNGTVHRIHEGSAIDLPIGCVHCMINKETSPVTVIETQSGLCREADNVRLLDFNNRPTIPLETKIEAQSAILYAEIHEEIHNVFQHENKPDPRLLDPKFRETIAAL